MDESSVSTSNMNFKKKMTAKEIRRLANYFDFIKRQYCIDCGKFDHWDDIKGTPIVSASHVIARGSAHRDEHYNNLVPQGVKCGCHRKFEEKTTEERLRLHKDHAIELTQEFDSRYPLL